MLFQPMPQLALPTTGSSRMVPVIIGYTGIEDGPYLRLRRPLMQRRGRLTPRPYLQQYALANLGGRVLFTIDLREDYRRPLPFQNLLLRRCT